MKKNKKCKKCKKCQGKGFIFGKNYIIKEGSCGYEPHEYGIKLKLNTIARLNQIRLTKYKTCTEKSSSLNGSSFLLVQISYKQSILRISQYVLFVINLKIGRVIEEIREVGMET